jgi:hypothetical protein
LARCRKDKVSQQDRYQIAHSRIVAHHERR